MTVSITTADCEQIVKKVEKSYQVRNFEIVPFRSQLQGLVGEHHTLKITVTNGNELVFFLKTLSKNPYLLELTKLLLMFEKEQLYYTTLLEKFEKEGIDATFAARGFLFKDYNIVLEDVDLAGYKGTKKRQLLDYDHCRTCMAALAKFHAAAMNFETKTGTELIRTYGDILADKFATDQDNPAARWLKSSIQALLQLIDLLPEDNRISREKFKETLLASFDTKTKSPHDLYSVLHNDLWTSNFLYLYKDGKPIDAKILDFQMITYGPVQSDLMQFLMTNTTKALRVEYSKELLEFYYERLEFLLENKAVLPGKTQFVASCYNYKIAGKVHAIVDHSFTFLSDELYKRATETEEQFRRFLYEDRALYVAEAFHNSKEFKEMLSNDVLELRDFFV